MRPPGWTDVPAAVSDWVFRACSLPDAPEPRIELLADLHADFERIHPIIDGNGRTGRLLTNLLLVRLGYPPAIIYKRDRRRYLNALTRADCGDPGPLGELLARAVLDNYYRLVLPAMAGPHKLVPLSALVTEEVTMRALRNAAARGRLLATRGSDGMWRSTRKAMDAYVASRYVRVDPAVASATCGECGASIPDPENSPVRSACRARTAVLGESISTAQSACTCRQRVMFMCRLRCITLEMKREVMQRQIQYNSLHCKDISRILDAPNLLIQLIGRRQVSPLVQWPRSSRATPARPTDFRPGR